MAADHRQNHRHTFGKHVALGPLGEGEVTRSFLAIGSRAEGSHELVVVKELKSELAAAPEARASFLDGARVACRLEHPNVAATYEVGDDGGAPYVATEYVDGQPLRGILTARTRGFVAPLTLLLQAIADTLAALEYAHELTDDAGAPLGLVHGGVSPSNVLVTYDGVVKVRDFGTSRLAGKTPRHPGAERYRAPELAHGAAADRRADIYSVGVLLGDILEGRSSWTSEASWSHHVAEMPIALEAIVARALQADPAARYATAEEMRLELVDFLEAQAPDADGVDVGRWLRDAFSDERAAARSLVESRMRALEATSAFAGLASEGTRPRSLGGAARFWASAALVGIVVAGSYAFMRRQDHAVATAAAEERAAVVQAVASEPAARTIRVVLSAEPTGAELVLDGHRLEGNPFALRAPKDGAEHSLVARADGYTPRTWFLKFDRDLELHVKLEPALVAERVDPSAPKADVTSAAGGIPVAATRPGAPSTKREGPAARPGPRRGLDGADPY